VPPGSRAAGAAISRTRWHNEGGSPGRQRTPVFAWATDNQPTRNQPHVTADPGTRADDHLRPPGAGAAADAWTTTGASADDRVRQHARRRWAAAAGRPPPGSTTGSPASARTPQALNREAEPVSCSPARKAPLLAAECSMRSGQESVISKLLLRTPAAASAQYLRLWQQDRGPFLPAPRPGRQDATVPRAGAQLTI